ncbi:hypothetical protein HA052_01650 [Chromobacterium haemolyticum]|uniref:Uncharacterized protein n=1 Tax=Chromobacterium fluminis TaxID=3044269 RepID=A0ABX0KZ83_9NEIS|nr:hypothetical protein [Chromobacterium haemolyticum]NHR03890.1 hypothetical protein [Chromobacterium haemolyticum]
MLHRVSCALVLSGMPFLAVKAEMLPLVTPAKTVYVVYPPGINWDKRSDTQQGACANFNTTFLPPDRCRQPNLPDYMALSLMTSAECPPGAGYWASSHSCVLPACPDASWTLSEDGRSCSRPDPEQCVETAMLAPWAKAAPGKPCPPPCKSDINAVTQEKLLAAIVYGESSVQQVKEEMYGIASAMVRKRDAWQQGGSLQKFLKKYPQYAYAVTDGNVRYKELMCASDAKKYTQAYEAARNALAYGVDYSNGGCFWDGRDLKVKGTSAYRYIEGFKFTSPSHNVFDIAEPPAKNKRAEFGFYDYVYESTSAYGETIFWKINDRYMTARGAKQCN